MPHVLVHRLLGLLLNYFGCGMLVKPHLNYWMRATVSKQKFDYSFLYLLGLEDQLDTLFCINIPLDTLNVIAPVSEVNRWDCSKHLKRSSPGRKRSFLVPKRLFTAPKVFVPSTKRACSSLAINMFVCNVICIWRWVAKTISSLVMNVFVCSVKSYSEVSSRNYLIAINVFVFY